MHGPVDGRTSETVVVVAGGDPVDRRLRDRLPPDAHVIGVDSGVDHALAIGLAVHEAVGDLDSVSPAGLAAVQGAGAHIERHPVLKDATDLELAVDRAVALRPRSLILLGGAGGRLDHLLGNVLLLARPDLADLDPMALMGPATVTVVHGGRSRTLRGRPGELVSLLAVHGPVGGVTTTGLRWPLSGATLRPGTSWGVSNELLAEQASVAVATGVLLVVQPGDALPTAAEAPARHECLRDERAATEPSAGAVR